MPKLLIFILLLGSSACASSKAAKGERDVLAELRAENARLEERLTELQERDLKEERATRKSCTEALTEEDKGENEERATTLQDSTPSDLPVVRLAPDDGARAAQAQDELSPSPSLSEAELQEAEEDSSTRPVLKVHGSHEAWVYHRPLGSGESANSKREKATKP